MGPERAASVVLGRVRGCGALARFWRVLDALLLA